MTAPGVITQRDSSAAPPPGAAPSLLVQYVKDLHNFTQSDSLARYKLAARNMLWADGEQWLDWNRRERSWMREPNPRQRIRATLNYTRPILRGRLQRLTSSPISFSASPQSDAADERDRCRVATQLLQARYLGADMDDHVRLALWLAFSCGVTAFKQFWDDSIGSMVTASKILPGPDGKLVEYLIAPDGQPISDESGFPIHDPGLAWQYRQGDVNTAVRSIFSLRMNPDAKGMRATDGARWLLDQEILPVEVIRDRFGDRAKNVQPHRGHTDLAEQRHYEKVLKAVSLNIGSELGFSATQSAHQNVPDAETQVLTECWEWPCKKYPNGRLIITAGDELLWPLDGDKEGLPDGLVPYVGVYDERRMFDWGGRPILNDLIPPQQAINRHWSWILEEQRAAGTAQWIGYDLPGVFDQISDGYATHIRLPAQTALVAQRDPKSLLSRVDPAKAASDRWQIIDQARMALFDIGAWHEVQRGQIPPGLDSGVAIEALQEAEQGQLHDTAQSLRRSLREWGRQVLTIAKARYGPGEERWIPVERPDMKYLVESVNGVDLPDPDNIRLDLDGYRLQSRAALHKEVKELWAGGGLDARTAVQLLDMGKGLEGAFASQTRHYSKARTENLAIERGEFTAVPNPEMGLFELIGADGAPFLLAEDDDHVIHLDVVQELILDTSKPWAVREIAIAHANGHRAALMVAQARAAAAAAPDGQPPKDGGASAS